jgi:plastocyanin
MRTAITISLLAGLVLSAAGCSQKESGTPDCSKSADSPSTGPCVSGLYDNYFENKDIYVKAGTTVTFKNEGKNTHTATADDASWTTPDLAPGSTGTHSFASAGTVLVHCRYHQSTGMVGTVHVVS